MTAGPPTKGGTHVLSAQARDAASLAGASFATRRPRGRADAPQPLGVGRRGLLPSLRRGHVRPSSPAPNPGAAPAAANRRLPERDLPRVRLRASGPTGELTAQ